MRQAGAVTGVQLCNEKYNDEEDAFMQWLYIHRPDLMSKEWRELFEQHFTAEFMAAMRKIPKNEFLQTYKIARHTLTRRPM